MAHNLERTLPTVAGRSITSGVRKELEYLNTFSISAHLIDEEGTLIDVNQCELNVLGYIKEEYVGRSFAQFVSAGLEQYQMRLVTGDTSLGGALIPLTVKTKSGERKHFLMNFEKRTTDGKLPSPSPSPLPPPPSSRPLSDASYGISGMQSSSTSPSDQFLCVLHDDVAKYMASVRETAAAKLVSFQDSFTRRIFHKMRTPLHVMCNALGESVHQSPTMPSVRPPSFPRSSLPLTFSSPPPTLPLTYPRPYLYHYP